MSPTVGLFVPCYIDQLYPDVAMATLELLERFGCRVEFPEAQTCCGQPMANAGLTDLARPLALRFVEIFKDYDYVVCPSGSCTAMVRAHYKEYCGQDPTYKQLKVKSFELVEFLTQVLKVERIEGLEFPHRVGLHQACHGLRELRLGKSSELMSEPYSQVRTLLETIPGLELVELSRVDECCGFGGTFAVSEEAVSCMMGLDRLHDHETAGAEIIASLDMSCLMHLDGLARRKKLPLRVMHVAEILAGRTAPVLAS
jgi:L-lactate dehydrogenase complex protein LldE